MVRNRELQEVARNAFVAENGARIFDGGTDIKIMRLRIVSRDKVEAAGVLIVDAGRIHEPAGAGRLKGFGQLAYLEAAEIRGQRHEFVRFQKLDHLLLAALVGSEER